LAKIKGIKPLPFHKPTGGGRPTKYHPSLARDYGVLRSEGVQHRDILDSWEVSDTNFDTYIKKDSDLLLAYKLAEGDKNKNSCQGTEEPEDVDQQLDMGEVEAISALRKVLKTAKSDNAVVSAARELLDRKRGKAAQQMNVETNAKVTHEHIMKLEPSEAYKMLVEGSNPIDIIEAEEVE
jgi:hypothetical protein